MNRFTGKVALVTGAAQGLGAATALRLAREGATVVVADLTAERGQGTAGEITSKGGAALALGVDVADRESADAVVERAVAEYGRLDVLVNNAGITRDNLVHKMSDDDWA